MKVLTKYIPQTTVPGTQNMLNKYWPLFIVIFIIADITGIVSLI